MGKHAFWMVSFQCLAKSLIVTQQICRPGTVLLNVIIKKLHYHVNA